MDNKKPKLAFLRAQRWLQGAERALEDKRWDDVIYSSQMAVEQGIKALLLLKGLIFKRVHDVSDEFIQLKNEESLSIHLRDKIEKIADILIFLNDQRAMAGYGFEEEIDVSFFKDSAKPALERAKFALKYIEQILKTLTKE